MRFNRNVFALTCLLCCGSVLVVAQKQPDPNSLGAKSGEYLLNLIRLNTNSIAAEGPSSKSETNAFNQAIGDSTKAWRGRLVADCNGQVSEDSAVNYSSQCAVLAEGLKAAGSTEKELKALVLGCHWDSTAGIGDWAALTNIVNLDTTSGFGNCAALASELIVNGNAQAAKVILGQADGCHGHNEAGNPKNLCFATAMQHPELFQDGELRTMAQEAYNRETDPNAARYLASIGINADVAAADANYRKAGQNAHQARQDQIAADNAAAAQRQQQADAQLPPLNQPANQIAQHGALAQQTTVRQATPQTRPQNIYNGNTACHNMNYCVQIVSSLFEKGANQTSGFLHIVVRNNCSQPIRITASVYAQNQSCLLSQTNNFDPGAQEDLGQNSDQSRYFFQANDNVTSGSLGNGCALVVANSCHL
jgi:hypothetical protein